jgi:hypothetical protein
LACAVIYLDLGRVPKSPVPIKEKLVPARLSLVDMEIQPHVLAVRIGQTIEVWNSDNCTHVIGGDCVKNKSIGFGIHQTKGPKDAEAIPPFVAPENVELRCSKHQWMTSWICCFDHPYFAVTKLDGIYSIPAPVKDGDFEVILWHESGVTQTEHVTVRGGKATADFHVTAPQKKGATGRSLTTRPAQPGDK